MRQANVQFYILENRVTRVSQVRLFGCPRKDTVTIKMSQEDDGREEGPHEYCIYSDKEYHCKWYREEVIIKGDQITINKARLGRKLRLI